MCLWKSTICKTFRHEIIVRPVGFAKTKPCTRFEIPGSSSFVDMFDRMPSVHQWSSDLGHAPFGKSYLCIYWAFPRRSYVPNLMSLAELVLKICSIVCQKFQRSRDIGHAPFVENFVYFFSSLPTSSSITNRKCLRSLSLVLLALLCQAPLYWRKWPLRMHSVTWPVDRGPETTKNLEILTPICLFTIQLSGDYVDD